MTSERVTGARASARPQASLRPDAARTGLAGQYRLSRVQLYNWGTFNGYHDLPVPRTGLLLTGQSGSGKSSLLDALSTVLVAPKDLRYNVAAQDASTSDRSRTVQSYVRGAYKRTTDEATGELRTAYLRPGATRAGVALTFTRLDPDDTVTLARLFHVRASARTSGDVSSVSLVLDGDEPLTSLLPYAAEGLDKRGLKRDMGQRGSVHDSYHVFAARMRRRLGMTSEVAQRLLHRTQAAKNLTSLDTLLRDFMLDEPETFAVARQAVEQFGELRQAHASVVETRQQQDTLLPLRDLAAQITACQQRAGAAQVLKEAVGPFVTQFKLTAYRRREDELRRRLARLAETSAQAEAAERAAHEEAERARRAVDGLSGGEMAVIEVRLERAADRLARVQQDLAALASVLDVLGADVPARRADLIELQETCRREEAELEAQRSDRQHEDRQVFARREELAGAMTSLRAQAEQVRRARSGMSPQLLTAREIVATAADVPVQALPFVGEIMQLVDGSERWRVAAEAVAGGFARTMVVPDHLYRKVAAAVDAHSLRTLLTYERILPEEPRPRTVAADALARHLRARPGHPYGPWLEAEITRRFPHHCVEDAEALAAQDRAVTLAGQVKLSATRHRKDDRVDLTAARSWSIGVDPADRLAELEQRYRELDRQVAQLNQRLGDLGRQERDAVARAQARRRVLEATWENLDLAGAQAEYDRQVAALAGAQELAPGLAVARQELERAQAHAESARDRAVEAATEYRAGQRELEEVRRHLSLLAQPDATGRDGTERADGGERASSAAQAAVSRAGDEREDRLRAVEELERRARRRRRHLDLDSVDAVARELADELDEERRQALGEQARAQQEAQAVMTRFSTRWPVQAASLRPDLVYLPDYLAALDSLQADDLPRHEQRFALLLSQQSQQNIVQLRQLITGAVREVARRIAPVNEALRQVEYAPGRHLTIEVRERRFQVVTDFLADLGRIVSGTLTMEEDSAEQAEQRFAVLSAVMSRLGSGEPGDVSWQRQCLDTRRHVSFMAIERDESGQAVDYYEGASGLSGGQRQKLVVFCLAAALRYQLTELGGQVPSYALVVLDEAFDKTDAEFTRAGLAVFRDFGFQLVLATPMTKIQIMEDYVGGAAVVTNSVDGDASSVHPIIYEAQDDGVARLAPVGSGSAVPAGPHEGAPAPAQPDLLSGLGE